MASVISGVSDLAVRIPEIWSPLMYPVLKKSLPKASFFERPYDGLMIFGDKVKVQSMSQAVGEVLTNDENEFSTEALVITSQDIDIDRRFSAAFEITDLAKLQSMDFAGMAQQELVYAVAKQWEAYVTGLLVPSAAAPDHDIAPAVASDLGAADLATAKLLLDEQYVPQMDRVAFLSPSYYSDLLTKQLVVSRDYTVSNSIQSGVVDALLGFTIVMDNSLPADTAFFCHKSALHVVMQQDLRIKISDQHSARRYQSVISADMVGAAKLMDNKRIVKISG